MKEGNEKLYKAIEILDQYILDLKYTIKAKEEELKRKDVQIDILKKSCNILQHEMGIRL
jgi:hypothetical protein